MFFDEKTPFFAKNKEIAPLIKYYAKKLRDPHAECDLWGFLWLVQNTVIGEKPLKYWAVCLRNEYIRLSKIEQKYCSLIDNKNPAFEFSKSLEIRLDFAKAFEKLSTPEKLAFGLRYFYDLPQNNCAELLEISRQAVHKNQSRAKEKIRAYFS